MCTEVQSTWRKMAMLRFWQASPGTIPPAFEIDDNGKLMLARYEHNKIIEVLPDDPFQFDKYFVCIGSSPATEFVGSSVRQRKNYGERLASCGFQWTTIS
mmetsp:Transcript_5781/g.8087  ORF Transcript_5781/g.8087 Transcript_5781/m.8087 type:complete len:100 (+) Transcript_5781:1682-1981(+)